MIIYIQPDPSTGENNFSIDVRFSQVDYDALVEEVIYHVSLKISSVKVERMELRFKGNRLIHSKRLNEYGIKEEDAIQMFETRGDCCLLL